MGALGQERKAALLVLAKRAGYVWDGEGSIGRLLVALADGGLVIKRSDAQEGQGNV